MRPSTRRWGSSFASFLLGDLSSASISEPYARGERFRSYALFAQDEWRATTQLTLSYGLRWEGNGAPFEPNGAASGFCPIDPESQSRWTARRARLFAGRRARPIGLALAFRWMVRRLRPAPRRGLPGDPKTVIRGSGGIYFAPGFRSRLIAYGFTNGNSISSPTGYDAGLQLDLLRRIPSNFPRAPFIDPSFQNGQTVSSILPDTSRMPQILTWTFSIQREVARNLAFEAHLYRQPLHPPDPGRLAVQHEHAGSQYLSLGNLLFQDISSAGCRGGRNLRAVSGFHDSADTYRRTVAAALSAVSECERRVGPARHRRFHSLQLKVTKRYSSGLTLLAFYTWSKNMTNSERGPIDLGPARAPFRIRRTAPAKSRSAPMDRRTCS